MKIRTEFEIEISERVPDEVMEQWLYAQLIKRYVTISNGLAAKGIEKIEFINWSKI